MRDTDKNHLLHIEISQTTLSDNPYVDIFSFLKFLNFL